MIVAQDGGPKKPSMFAGMTKEEKELKIREMQKAAREKRMAEDAKNARENE